MPEIKLKPCPFCGNTNPIIQRRYVAQSKSIYAVQCRKCYARMVFLDRKYKAIEAWNRRSDDLIRCKDCKYLQKQSYENFGKESYIRYGCKYFCDEVHLDGFCSSAVRRSEND